MWVRILEWAGSYTPTPPTGVTMRLYGGQSLKLTITIIMNNYKCWTKNVLDFFREQVRLRTSQ